MMAGPILTPALVYVFNKKNSRTPSKCTYNICVKKSYKRPRGGTRGGGSHDGPPR